MYNIEFNIQMIEHMLRFIQIKFQYEKSQWFNRVISDQDKNVLYVYLHEIKS